jgi:methionyl-tRNA formyltransferase
MNVKNKYIFFSSSRFGLWVLRKIIKKVLPLFVITKKPKPKGRKKQLELNVIAEFCLKKKIPFFYYEDSLEILKNYNIEFALLAGFGKILKKEILDLFPKGILGIHPSLLPDLKGPSPIQFTILENKEPGVTLFLLDENIDNGPILRKEKLNIKKDFYYDELEKELGLLGGKVFLETIQDYLDGKLEPQAQKEEGSYTKKIEKNDAKITKLDSAELAYRKIRAFCIEPIAWIEIRINSNNKMLQIYKAKKIKENVIKSWIKGKEINKILKKEGEKFIPQILFLKNQTMLVLNDGILLLEKVQLEGKKIMSGKEFFNGYYNKKIEIVN